jgi:transposase-like protein
MNTKNAVTPADDELEMLETDATDETEAEEITFSPKDLANELGTDAKSFRRWLRNFTPERAADNGGRWAFTADRKAEIIAAYNATDEETDAVDEESDSEPEVEG